jgi:uncharacterized phage-associated protein
MPPWFLARDQAAEDWRKGIAFRAGGQTALGLKLSEVSRILVRMFEQHSGAAEPHRLEIQHYPGRMTVSAHDVAAALRDRLPGLPAKKLHKLLYYCQGHHLAAFGTPLFGETISAWDMGPVVGSLWFEEKQGITPVRRAELGEAELNTVGYVVSRYGKLTGKDLEHLSHSETPWKTANAFRMPGESTRIDPDWIREYFATEGAADGDEEEPWVDSAVVRAILKGADERRSTTPRPDNLDSLRARLRPSA